MQVMGIDVGTTGVKAAVFTADGAMKGYGFQEYDVETPGPGLAEQDARHIWHCTRQVMAQAAAEAGGEIAAISLSVQGDAVIPLDAHGDPLGPAHLGMDYRGQKQAREFGERLGERALFQKTGMRPHPMNTLVKILWILENQPDLAAKTATFATYADYILAKLGSEGMVIDRCMASRTMAYNLQQEGWDAGILQAAGLDAGHLSRIVPCGAVVGRLASAVAGETGIRPGALLVAGGHDQACAALGAGIVREGLALDSHGTAEVISACFTTPQLGQAMYEGYFPCYRHVLDGLYFTFALNHTGGILMKWYRDTLAYPEVLQARKTGERPFEQIAKTATAGPSSLLVLPHWGGSGTPSCDPASKGAILGLTLGTTRQDIAKAMMESLALEMRLNREVLAGAGISFQSLRCVGGGARSPIDLQLKADVLQIPVTTLQTREAACFGAALLAMKGARLESSLPRLAALVKTGKTYEPNPAFKAPYDEKYCIYRELYTTLGVVNHLL